MRHTDNVGGRTEKVKRETKDGCAETYAVRENEWCMR